MNIQNIRIALIPIFGKVKINFKKLRYRGFFLLVKGLNPDVEILLDIETLTANDFLGCMSI